VITLGSPSLSDLTATINGVAQPTTQGSSISKITLDWGDGQTSNGLFPESHTYTEPGRYTIIITAFDTNGLSTTAQQNVNFGGHVSSAGNGINSSSVGSQTQVTNPTDSSKFPWEWIGSALAVIAILIGFLFYKIQKKDLARVKIDIIDGVTDSFARQNQYDERSNSNSPNQSNKAGTDSTGRKIPTTNASGENTGKKDLQHKLAILFTPTLIEYKVVSRYLGEDLQSEKDRHDKRYKFGEFRSGLCALPDPSQRR